MNVVETMVLTEKQQVHVRENNLVRRIVVVKGADRRIMDELRRL